MVGEELLLSCLSCLQMLITFQNPTYLLTEEDCNMPLQISLIISNAVYCVCSFGDRDAFLLLFPLKVVEFTLKFLTLGSAKFILINHNHLISDYFCWFGYILIFVVYDNYICTRIKKTILFPPIRATTYLHFSTTRIPGGEDSRK